MRTQNKELCIVTIINIVVTLVTVLLQEYDRVQALSHNMVVAIFIAFFGIIVVILWLFKGEKLYEIRNKIRKKGKVSE